MIKNQKQLNIVKHKNSWLPKSVKIHALKSTLFEPSSLVV